LHKLFKHMLNEKLRGCRDVPPERLSGCNRKDNGETRAYTIPTDMRTKKTATTDKKYKNGA